MPNVDILGDGNVVAALSKVPKGIYRIERGTLDDLNRLPPMRKTAATTGRNADGRIPEGHRNKALFEFCRVTVAQCDTLDDLFDCAKTWADSRLEGHLSEAEITRTVTSVWTYRGGRKRIMNQIVEGPQWGALTADLEALALLAYLSAENRDDAEFMIADGLGEARGWARRFVPAARKKLLELSIIKCTRPRGNGRAALYQWVTPP